MKAKWVKVSSVFNAWKCIAGGELILVFQGTREDDWQMKFVMVGQTTLDATNCDDAKKEALERVSRILEGILDDIR